MQHAFDPCPEDRAFRFSNGARARSLDEFRHVVTSAPADVLLHHRGHFHYWVRDVLQEPQLADKLKQEGERARDGESLRRTLDPLLERALTEAKRSMPTPAGGRFR